MKRENFWKEDGERGRKTISKERIMERIEAIKMCVYQVERKEEREEEEGNKDNERMERDVKLEGDKDKV